MAFAAGSDGLRSSESGLEGSVDFSVHDFDGLVGDVGGEAAAAFAARLGVCLNLVFEAPSAQGDVTQYGIGYAGGKIALHALGGFAGVEDGQFRRFVPAVEFRHHRIPFLSSPEKGVSRSGAEQRAADGAPVGDAALADFEHGKGELIVRGAVFFAHKAHDGVECAVRASQALVPVAVIGHGGAFLRIKLMGLPTKVPVDLLKAFGLGIRRNTGPHNGCDGTADGESAQCPKHRSSGQFHSHSSLQARLFFSAQYRFCPSQRTSVRHFYRYWVIKRAF